MSSRHFKSRIFIRPFKPNAIVLGRWPSATLLSRKMIRLANVIVIVAVVFELLEKRYRMLDEIFKENSIAAAILAGSFVLGIFYTVAQIVIH